MFIRNLIMTVLLVIIVTYSIGVQVPLTNTIKISPLFAPLSPLFCPKAAAPTKLRSGPGLSYEAMEESDPDFCLTIVGRTKLANWFLLDTGSWIPGFLVVNPPPLTAVPIISPLPTPQNSTPKPN